MKPNLAALLVVAAALSGCSIPTIIGPVVDYYCGLPDESRYLTRLGIDTRTYPNKVRIQCEADLDR